MTEALVQLLPSMHRHVLCKKVGVGEAMSTDVALVGPQVDVHITDVHRDILSADDELVTKRARMDELCSLSIRQVLLEVGQEVALLKEGPLVVTQGTGKG